MFENSMFGNSDVQTMLPVDDLERAENFYGGTLGLTKETGAPGVATTYRAGNARLNVYQSKFAGTNRGTAAMWEVDDVDRTVSELQSRGVIFERYDDLPNLKREGPIHRADGFAVAWFKDPSGNILSVQTRAHEGR